MVPASRNPSRNCPALSEVCAGCRQLGECGVEPPASATAKRPLSLPLLLRHSPAPLVGLFRERESLLSSQLGCQPFSSLRRLKKREREQQADDPALAGSGHSCRANFSLLAPTTATVYCSQNSLKYHCPVRCKFNLILQIHKFNSHSYRAQAPTRRNRR